MCMKTKTCVGPRAVGRGSPGVSESNAYGAVGGWDMHSSKVSGDLKKQRFLKIRSSEKLKTQEQMPLANSWFERIRYSFILYTTSCKTTWCTYNFVCTQLMYLSEVDLDSLIAFRRSWDLLLESNLTSCSGGEREAQPDTDMITDTDTYTRQAARQTTETSSDAPACYHFVWSNPDDSRSPVCVHMCVCMCVRVCVCVCVMFKKEASAGYAES